MPQIGVWDSHGAEIEQLIRQGISMAEIGRRFGVSRERIRAALKRHNLPTRAPMLKQKEVMALLGCCQPFLTGLDRKGLISPIHSGGKQSPRYYPEGELKKIRAIMEKKGMVGERRKKSEVLQTKLFLPLGRYGSKGLSKIEVGTLPTRLNSPPANSPEKHLSLNN